MTEAIAIVKSQVALAEVETLAATLGAAEAQLEHGYGILAFKLKEVSENRHWEGTYASFGEFLDHLKQTHHIGRAQLYSYLSTARDLEGSVTEEQLSQMGISKALVLRSAKNENPILPADAVTKALDPEVTAKELKKLLWEAGHVSEPEEGTWMDLNFQFYVTEEERTVLNSAANAARHMDPPVSDNLTESASKKEIALRWAMEFLGSHSETVVEGGKGL